MALCPLMGCDKGPNTISGSPGKAYRAGPTVCTEMSDRSSREAQHACLPRVCRLSLPHT